MPDEVSIIRNNWTTRKQPFTPPRRPIISDNGHLEGHYPAYTMVTYEINIKSIINTIKWIELKSWGFFYKSRLNPVYRRCPATEPERLDHSGWSVVLHLSLQSYQKLSIKYVKINYKITHSVCLAVVITVRYVPLMYSEITLFSLRCHVSAMLEPAQWFTTVIR